MAVLSLFAAAILATPVQAQDTASTNAPTAPAKHKKHETLPFHGKLSSIDAAAMTLTVGERTFVITSTTKISKDGTPATLAEAVVGEPVSGAYKKGADGKLTATSVHLGGKGDGEKKHKKKTEPETGSSTNSVPN